MTDADVEPMLICMRTTLNLDDELIARARLSTGVKEKTRLLHLGLEALIQREAARREGGQLPSAGRKSKKAPGSLPVSKARGGLAAGFVSLKEAINANDLEADRRKLL